MSKRQLLLGCGIDKKLRVGVTENLVTLDYNPDRKPDIVWDLTKLPLPFLDNEFDEVHAYHVLEHLWSQGDYGSFFAFFTEMFRIMKQNALMYIAVPAATSEWALGDPSHKCIIHPLHFQFLDQSFYENACASGGMASDFRNIYAADFRTIDIRSHVFETLIILQRK